MGVERRKIICVRMLSFSPWWRHVSATVGLVSPLFLGLAALLISLTFLRMRLDTNLWLFVDQGMQHTWAGVRKLHLYILGLVFRQGFSCVRTNFTTCAVQPVLYGAVTAPSPNRELKWPEEMRFPAWFGTLMRMMVHAAGHVHTHTTRTALWGHSQKVVRWGEDGGGS